jgi:hypothetical protein
MSLLNGLKDAANCTFTENGAMAYKTTKSSIVDFFSQAGAMRTRSESDIIDMFNNAFSEDKLIAIKLLFYFRDARFGAGERRLFRIIIKYLAQAQQEIVKKNLQYISEFGRYDDLLVLLDTPLKNDVISLIRTQLTNDITSESPSLLGKWLPSINASSKITKKYAKIIAKELNLRESDYRIVLSTLRKKINLVETKITNKNYNDIDYSKVPSCANMKYKKAFWRNDEERYNEFVNKVNKGEAKVNAKVLYPYEIVRDIINGSYNVFYGFNENNLDTKNDMTLDMLWNNLPSYIEDYSNTLAVVDGSGSMTSPNYLPLSTAIALGIYFAEKNKGAFSNHFITFSERPRIIEILGDNIATKVRNVMRYKEIANTNIESVFDLILDTAKRKNLSQDDIPKRIVIISDMQFDKCAVDNNGYVNNTTQLFNIIKQKWQGTGYKIPKLTFWNVNATKESFPMTVDEAGVQFVSGHSPSIFTSILKDNFVTPLDLVLDVINKERYDVITI